MLIAHQYIIKQMLTTASKIFTLVLLVVVGLMFTGLLSTASAVDFEKAAKSCCDECNKNERQRTGQCSTPDCPMFFCLSVNVVSPFTLSELSGSINIPQFSEEFIRESQPKLIFHPPVIV